MRKRDVLRLTRRDVIMFCDNALTARATYWAEGEIIRVTPRGGVLVRVIEAKQPGTARDWSGPNTGPGAGREQWISYAHVVAHRGRRRRTLAELLG